jgi:transketolase
MAGASSALKTKRELGKATRDAFGRALEALGANHPNLVVVDGDVGNSTRTEWFGTKYPERFFNVGIAESNLVGVAAGLAASGKTSVIASFAAFIMCNAYDQIRMSVAYPGLNVKVVGSHAGISIGEDGASQMGIEDVALACALPGFVVIVPADDLSAQAATAAMLEYDGPVYLRVGRPEVPRLYSGNTAPFTIGKANTLRDGTDLTIVANGLLVAPALDAAETLADEGISARVLDMHTVKPIDREALEAAARETGALVVAEEHLAHGGLGSVVAMTLAESHPVPIRFVNLGDQFGESGSPDALIEKFGLTAAKVAEAAKAAHAAKLKK